MKLEKNIEMKILQTIIAFLLILSFSVQASLVTGNSNFRRNVSNTGRITLNSQAEWFRLTEPGLCQVLGYIRASHESGNRHPGTKHRARFYDPSIGRFISRDPVFGNIGNPISQHPYLYGNLSPYRYTDPMGKAAETPWDAASLAVGLYSIKSWNKNTSWLDKGLDILGVTVDGLATATPFVPGGAGMALKAWRASRTFRALNKTDQLLSAASGLYSSGSSMAEEGVGFGNTAQMMLSAAEILPKTPKNLEFVGESPGLKSQLNAELLPKNAGTTTSWNEITRRIKKYCGIDPDLASERLHQIKDSASRGGADNVIFDLSGNVYDPETREWLGSLTAGGALKNK